MPDHRGLEPLTQTRAAQTAALEVTAFSTMDAPFMGIASGATRFNLTFSGVSGESPLISERTDYAERHQRNEGARGDRHERRMG